MEIGENVHGHDTTNYDTFQDRRHTSTPNKDKSNSDPQIPLEEAPFELSSLSTFQQVLPPLLILCGSVLFSGMHTSVRFAALKYEIPSFVIIVFRGVFQCLVVSTLIWSLGSEVVRINRSRNSFILLVLRGLFGALAIVGKFGSLSRLPVAVATSLFSTTPIFAAVMGWILLGEKMTKLDIFALCMSTSASVLIGVSGNDAEAGEDALRLQQTHVSGVFFALLGALATSSVLVTMRGMGERVHFLFSVFAHGVGMTILPLVLTFSGKGNVGTTVQFYAEPLTNSGKGAYVALFCVVIFSFMAALCQNRGAQLLSPARVGVLRAFDIPINFLVAFIVLGEFPDSAPQLIGCGMIIVSTALMAYNAVHN